MGEILPCQSFLRKKDGEILKLSTIGGVTVGQDCYYLPVDDVINVIKDYPVEVNEDEEIRKELLLDIPKVFPHDKAFRYIAYLEKQGERKHQYKSRPRYVGEENLLGKTISNKKTADKVEPKFKVGDCVVVVDDGRIGRIIACTKDFADVDLEFSCLSTRVNNIRPWTIQDAKSGDVLVYRGEQWVFLYKDRLDNTTFRYYALVSEKGLMIDDVAYTALPKSITPATKEQRDLLFQKMKEYGYEWDAEKKELKKIEQKPTLNVEIPFGAKDSELEEITYDIPKGYHAEIEDDKVVIKKGGHKPSWSDDDEAILSWCISDIERAKYCKSQTKPELCDIEINWLKALKDRYTWKPSKEQMDGLKEAIEFLGCTKTRREQLQSLYEQLKKLK